MFVGPPGTQKPARFSVRPFVPKGDGIKGVPGRVPPHGVKRKIHFSDNAVSQPLSENTHSQCVHASALKSPIRGYVIIERGDRTSIREQDGMAAGYLKRAG
jgi:hypothetical protein